MIARYTLTIALIGAMVAWLSSARGLADSSRRDADPNAVLSTTAGTRTNSDRNSDIQLADILMSDWNSERGAGAVLEDGLSLLNRLNANAERHHAIEQKLPASFILVNIPQARLWMVRDGVVEGSMRVVVGRQDQPTPEMTTELTHVILDPRWNVPTDMVRSSLAPEAARTDGRSLTDADFEVMTGWRDDATVMPAGAVNWQAVAAGRLDVAVRQKAGDANAMGSAKFVMTNDDGIYLHDTPDRTVFQRERRALSAGCVRVEDYKRLVDFLVPHSLNRGPDADRPTYVRLGATMPIFLTYLTAVATDEGPVLFPDPYQLDS